MRRRECTWDLPENGTSQDHPGIFNSGELFAKGSGRHPLIFPAGRRGKMRLRLQLPLLTIWNVNMVGLQWFIWPTPPRRTPGLPCWCHPMFVTASNSQPCFRIENNRDSPSSFQNRNEKRHKKTLAAFGRWAEEYFGRYLFTTET
jgi:hypothetical protein